MSNHRLLAETARAVRGFTSGRSDLETLQATLRTVSTLLESTEDSGEAKRVISDVESDLELIKLTVFGDEAHPAAMVALEPLLPLLPQSGLGDLHNCRACGYRSPTPPWGDDGESPDFGICPCCQVEAGYEDAGPEGARRYREEWIARGAPWSDPDEPHDGLTTEERLSHVPPGFE